MSGCGQEEPLADGTASTDPSRPRFMELPYKVKPPSIVVKAIAQPSIVIDLAVLAAVDGDHK
jgi:hypothetical protein